MADWLRINWSWLCTCVFIAVSTSTVIGLKEGSKGGAIAVSNFSSAIMALVLYPLLDKWGYGGQFVGLLGLFCGGCGLAMFGVLISLGNIIEGRRAKLAGAIIDRVVPEAKE